MGLYKKYRDEFFIVLLLTFFAISLLAVIPELLTSYRYGSDIYHYYSGIDPDGNPLPYPSLALVYFGIIRFIFSEGLLFALAFGYLSIIWFCLLVLFYSKMLNRSDLVKTLFVFTPIFFLVPMKVEIVSITLAFLGVYFFTLNKRMLGWFLVIIATFVKVFPIVLLPLFFVLELKNIQKNVHRIALAVALTIILFFSASATNLHAIAYNAERGIETESVYASILFLVNTLRPTVVSVEYSFGSYNLVLPSSLGFLPFLTLLIQAAAVLSFLVLFYFDKKKESRIWLYAFLVLTAMVFFGKILSPQFILWSLAFAVPIIKYEKLNLLYPLCLLTALLTVFLYPLFFGLIIIMDISGIIFLFVRNLTLAALLFYVGFVILKSGKP